MLASLYKNLTNSMDVTEITRSFINKVEDLEKFFRKLYWQTLLIDTHSLIFPENRCLEEETYTVTN